MQWWEATIDPRYHYQKLLNMSNEPTTLNPAQKLYIETNDMQAAIKDYLTTTNDNEKTAALRDIQACHDNMELLIKKLQ